MLVPDIYTSYGQFLVHQMRTRLLFSTVALLTFIFNANGQNSSGQFKADSIFIYKDFKEHGTTANLWHNHRDLDSANAPRTRLNEVELKEFVDIFKPIPSKKLFQTKYGGDICYVLVYEKGIRTQCVVYATLESGSLHDLDNMKCWTINSMPEKSRFYELVKKNWP